MFKSITLWTLLLLCLLSSCGKQAYFFPATTGAYQQARQQQQAVPASSFSPAAGEAGPALASLERVPVEKYQSSPQTRALVKHLSGEIKNGPKAAGAPHRPVALEENKSGPGKKLTYQQKKTAKLGKIGMLLGLAGLAFLLLATVLPLFVFPGFLAAILGLVFSVTALTDIKRGPKDLKDRGKAKVGLILGVITLVLSLIISLHKYQW